MEGAGSALWELSVYGRGKHTREQVEADPRQHEIRSPGGSTVGCAVFKGRKQTWVLTGVAQLAGCHPKKQNVAGSIPGQGIGLGCRFSPQLGCIGEATN